MILVINSGSSSIKYQLIDPSKEITFAKGLVERIGESIGKITHENLENNTKNIIEEAFFDHSYGINFINKMFQKYGPNLDKVNAVGHRVVQGGSKFIAPTIINTDVIEEIEKLSELAPLHNPPALAGIKGAIKIFPNVEHVAVFDTAFHASMPPESYTYALPKKLIKKYNIRRYGFHGTSHSYVSKKCAKIMQIPIDKLNCITLHIGNGASATAIKNGKSYKTSMGLTPLEGLVMGTRCGSIDPAIILYLERKGYTPDQLDNILNKKSGMLGLCKSNDIRDVIASIATEDASANLALKVYCQSIKATVGAYLALLGKCDSIVFTAGVGENNALVRELSLNNLENLGILLDYATNNNVKSGKSTKISAPASKIAVYVIPTDEELEIAKQVAQTIGF